MAEIVTIVKDGMVQDVFSTDADIEVTVLDLDTEEGMAREETIQIPKHSIY